jgi:chromosome segregation protein
MKLSRVKLTGFKSFVDPAELRIMPGLTGIVGPNGCGKSNLLEAIRWAMGEGSSKSLRGTAMDDVIFAGTEKRPQRQFAEVSLLAETDEGETEIVRRIERGAGSAYRINGRDARARDAQLIFADAATGAHSPALVSQGRIGAVIAAKPSERRAMLEEAAGIAGLHVRRREAEIRLKATEANLTRVGEAMAEMDLRIGALRRQARSAERYRKLSDDIRTAEGRLIFARWRDAAAAAAAAKAEAATADDAVRVASEAQMATAAVVRAATEALAVARAAAQRARDAASDARHALSTAEAERAALDRRIAALAEAQARLVEDRMREGELARDAGDALLRLGDEIKALEARMAGAVASRPDVQAQLDTRERDGRAAEVALAQALAAQAARDAERRVADAALTTAQLALARATQDRDRIANETAALPALAAAQATLDVAGQARTQAEADATATTTALDSAEVARAGAAERLPLVETAHAEARAVLVSLESEARSLAAVKEGGGALAQVSAAPGYEMALAAALSDDLGADVGRDGGNARRWEGAEVRGDDPPVAGERLAAHVTAPAELARRLAQILVADADEGQALAVGQRLVTTGGRLRRWDGFVAERTGAAAGEALKRRNRLAAIDAALPAARAAADTAASARDHARAAIDTAARHLEETRRAREAADNALRAALRAEDAAMAAAEALARRHEEIAARRSRAEDVLLAVTAEAAAARVACTALPPTNTDIDVAGLEREAAILREQVSAARGALVTLDTGIAADRARLAAAQTEAEGWRQRSGKTAKRVEDMAKRAATLDSEAAALADAPRAAGDTLAALAGALAARTTESEAAGGAERIAETTLRTCEADAARAGEALAAARELRAGAQARAENQDLRRVEMGRVSGERFECPAALLPERAGFSEADVGAAGDESARLERVTLERERLGPVNLVAESELAEIEGGRETTLAEHAELTEATHRLRGSIGSLNREGRERLRAAFEAVDGHFRTLFRTLFNGGEAHLALIESDDPLEAGLEIMAQPPGKKLTSLTLLSGGEQALTAVALIFALFLTNPAPLCVLDEVDAPLDDANVERFCDLLDEMARDTATRYLIVTHNAVTMARMHRLYGVTMIEQGISRLVSVDLGGAEALLAAE